MPQNATLTYFSAPIPTISHFVVLGFARKTKENLWKIFKILKTEFLSFKKKVVSSTSTV